MTEVDRYVESFAAPLTKSLWLSIGIVLLAVALVGNIGLELWTLKVERGRKPYIVRIDKIGEAQAVNAGTENYQPQLPEIRYFLSRFCELYFSRNRYTIRRDLPASLWFMDAQMAFAVTNEWKADRTIQKFLTSPQLPEIDVDVRQVSVADTSDPPYQATVDFYEIAHTMAGDQRALYTARITFTRLDKVPNEMIKTNPLGFTVLAVHTDRALTQ
jgi:type IV secretory pathway TrbF-like protein